MLLYTLPVRVHITLVTLANVMHKACSEHQTHAVGQCTVQAASRLRCAAGAEDRHQPVGCLNTPHVAWNLAALHTSRHEVQ